MYPFFKSLSSRYTSVVQIWHRQHPGRPVTESEFGNLFRIAYGEAVSVSKAESGFRKLGIHPFNHLIFTNEDFVAAAVTNQEQNTSNNAPIVEHTICLLNNPRQEHVKTKCISTSISDSQETSTNCYSNVFSKFLISNKISIPEIKIFAQLLDESVLLSVNILC